jgi:hypothetical protein
MATSSGSRLSLGMEDWSGNGVVRAGGGRRPWLRFILVNLGAVVAFRARYGLVLGTDDGRLDAILNLDLMNCLLNKAGLNFSP